MTKQEAGVRDDMWIEVARYAGDVCRGLEREVQTITTETDELVRVQRRLCLRLAKGWDYAQAAAKWACWQGDPDG